MARQPRLIDHESTLDGVVDDMISEVESLRDEIGDWKENLEERGRDSTAKYDEVSECYDALDNVANDQPKQPDKLPAGLPDKLQWQTKPPKRIRSRTDRLNSVTHPARLLLDKLGEFLDSRDDKHAAWKDTDRDEWVEYHEKLEEACDALDEVSFPGMFG